MTRQLDIKKEERESERRLALVRCVEYSLEGALESMGIQLKGFAVTFRGFECFMVLKIDVEGRRMVSYVSSDTLMNVLLKAQTMAAHNQLRWTVDKYKESKD